MSNDAPLWIPSAEHRDATALHRLVRFVRKTTAKSGIGGYAPLYDFSIRHPEKFWPLVWEFCGIRATGISGKIAELAVRAVIHGETVNKTDALANPGALETYCALADTEATRGA